MPVADGGTLDRQEVTSSLCSLPPSAPIYACNVTAVSREVEVEILHLAGP
jgi:hypothetical protein